MRLAFDFIGASGTLMADYQGNTEEAYLRLAFAPIHRKALGMAFGIVLGGLLFIATLVLAIRGGKSYFDLLNQFFWGYSVSLVGAFIGFLWAFGVGFALGWCFAVTRNLVIWIWLTVVRSRAEMDQYSDFLDHL
jgi:hypothetical protein